MNDNLLSYLNDHSSGAAFALDMLDRLRHATKNHLVRDRLDQLFKQIEEDRLVLRGLIERLEGHPSSLKEAGAWFTEKLSRLKLAATDSDGLGRFEILEALSLGVLGKLKLWVVLSSIAPEDPQLGGLDFNELAARAQMQHDQIESLRLDAARGALLERARQAQHT